MTNISLTWLSIFDLRKFGLRGSRQRVTNCVQKIIRNFTSKKFWPDLWGLSYSDSTHEWNSLRFLNTPLTGGPETSRVSALTVVHHDTWHTIKGQGHRELNTSILFVQVMMSWPWPLGSGCRTQYYWTLMSLHKHSARLCALVFCFITVRTETWDLLVMRIPTCSM